MSFTDFLSFLKMSSLNYDLIPGFKMSAFVIEEIPVKL